MLHGKWYKGVDDLEPLGRRLEPEDKLRWHLHITQDGHTIGYSRVMAEQKTWTMEILEYSNPLALDLLLRQVKRKAQEFGVTAINSVYNNELQAFGFEKTGGNAMYANPIILPIYCKE